MLNIVKQIYLRILQYFFKLLYTIWGYEVNGRDYYLVSSCAGIKKYYYYFILILSPCGVGSLSIAPFMCGAI